MGTMRRFLSVSTAHRVGPMNHPATTRLLKYVQIVDMVLLKRVGTPTVCQ
jgi:hypothetical protein